MKCVICHSDEIELKEVKEELEIGNDIIYVPVEVPICKHCGEKYYDRRTMSYLEKVEEELIKEHSGLKEVGKVLLYNEKKLSIG